jgi:hypothetical protein
MPFLRALPLDVSHPQLLYVKRLMRTVLDPATKQVQPRIPSLPTPGRNSLMYAVDGYSGGNQNDIERM